MRVVQEGGTAACWGVAQEARFGGRVSKVAWVHSWAFPNYVHCGDVLGTTSKRNPRFEMGWHRLGRTAIGGTTRLRLRKPGDVKTKASHRWMPL